MLNAYQLGFLSAQPQVFTKAASLISIRNLVLGKFAAEASLGNVLEEGGAMGPPPMLSQEQSLRDAIAGGGGDVQAKEMLAKMQGLDPMSPASQAMEQKLVNQDMTRMTPPAPPAPAPEGLGTRAGKAIDEGAAYAGEKAKGLWDKTKDLASTAGSKVKGLSSDINVSLGGAKDKHTRTLIALASLLAAGGGAYAMGRSGGGNQRERA